MLSKNRSATYLYTVCVGCKESKNMYVEASEQVPALFALHNPAVEIYPSPQHERLVSFKPDSHTRCP